MSMEKEEKCAFDKVINVLTDHNLVQTKDYVIKNYNKGCFYIRFCPKQHTVLDIEYFYEMIPNISIFKIKYDYGIMYLNLKIRLRK